ncbi:MAG: hypothetical protein LBT19_02945 [Candidatus Nomurabacteria bacterium]|nr:hypothetical protein [Candidatus Nomurabacteria bacterium]
MKLKKIILSLGLVASLGIAGLAATPTYAAGDCAITAGVVDMIGTGDAGTDLCNIDSTVTTINYNGTIAEFGEIVNAYNLAGWGDTSGLTAINATISDTFSTDQVSWISSLAGALSGTTINLTTNGDFVYMTLPYAIPAGIAIDFASVIVHLPAGTDIADAVDLFNSIGDNTVLIAVASDYTVNSETGTITVHLPEGKTLADLVDTAASLGGGVMVAENGANNPYVVTDASDAIVIHLPVGTTQADALNWLSGLDVDATAVVDGEDGYTIVLAIGKAPKVVLAAGDGLGLPKTGAFTQVAEDGVQENAATRALVVLVASVGVAVVLRKQLMKKER